MAKKTKQTKRPEPVQSIQERDELIEKLAPTLVQVKGISLEEAKARILGLSRSGILAQGSPDDPRSQMAIDMFLSVPSQLYAE